jgi:hypothetical protein
MIQKMAKIFSLVTCALLLASMFTWPAPASAGLSAWSVETTPSRTYNTLGPPGIDVRDLAIGNNDEVIYAAPGDSVSDNVVYKSTDGGIKWTALVTPIKVYYVAVAPNDNDLVVIANNSSKVYFSDTGNAPWQSLGIVRELPAGLPAVTIYDLAISPVKDHINYVAVSGKKTGDIAELWYINLGGIAAAWHEAITPVNGFQPSSEITAIAFSPSFASDATLVAIADNATANVTLQMLKITDNLWNNIAGFTNFPCTVVNTNLTRVTAASLAFIPNYISYDSDYRKVFIGLTIEGDAAAKAASGIYRIEDIVSTNIYLNKKIHSVAYDGSYLLAGSGNTTAVYRCNNPFAAVPTINQSANTKNPGGENSTLVAWLGGTVIAGTAGNESAFAISDDNGKDFDDISLIDTTINLAKDVAISSSGSRVYLVSENGTDTSLWHYDTYWRRVFSQIGSINYIVRIAPSNSDIVYMAQVGTKNIFYNDSGGRTQWLSHVCTINIRDVAAASSQVLYVINNAGDVTQGTSNGLLWSAAVSTTLSSGATVISIGINTVFVGSQDGYVAYSYDAGTTWTKINKIVDFGAGNVQIVPDESFETNHIIYAACNTPGRNIVRWKIGTSAVWTDIIDGIIGGGVFGLAITSNTLYALEYNAVSNNSTLWRLISPTTAAADSTEWTVCTTNVSVKLNAQPQALKASTNKLWAINTGVGANKLFSYTDVIIDVNIALIEPINGYIVQVNPWTTLPYDIVFSWYRPSVATEYELIIARDSTFLDVMATISVNMTDDVAYVTLGPNQPAPRKIFFTHAVQYYWRVRTTAPGYSRFSETWAFIINPMPLMLPETDIQITQQMETGLDPTFSWLPLGGVTEYQFQLGEDPEMTSPLVDTFTTSTSIKPNITLEFGRTYFWHVRASQPLYGDWSNLGTFSVTRHVYEDDVPLVIVTTTLPLTVPSNWLVETFEKIITPGYLHFIVFLIIMLFVIVFMLMAGRNPILLLSSVRQRLNVPITFRRQKPPRAEPVKPQPKLKAVPVRPRPKWNLEPEPNVPPTAAPEVITPHPALVEKDTENAAAIFAAKSLAWMIMQQEKNGDALVTLSIKERLSLGKNVAGKIHDLSRKENIYVKYPEDAVMLLNMWAEYGSRNDVNEYLTKSFERNPYNAIKFLKCYLPPAAPGQIPPSTNDFTMMQYTSIAKVVNPDNIYAALTKFFKFKADAIEERVPVAAADSSLAYQFMRLHHEAKGKT